jgi:hypothetical protein
MAHICTYNKALVKETHKAATSAVVEDKFVT